MSTVKAINHQVGNDSTATNNFTWYQPSVPDGTVRLGVGISGATSADVITANNSSYVGVGTSSPQVTFQVNGVIRAATANDKGVIGVGESAGGTTTNCGLWRGDANSAVSGGVVSTGGNYLNLGGYSGMVFTTGAASIGSQTERMRIDSSGFVQINQVGTVPSLGAYLTVTAPTASYSNITLKDTGTTYGTGTQYISFANSSNTTAGSIQHNAASTVNFATSSDARLKENIVNSPSSLDAISKAKVRSFDWKEDGHHVDFGFIAQELYEVYPEAVCKGDDEDEITNPRNTWQVDYGKITPLLLKAIQELKAELDELKAKVNA